MEGSVMKKNILILTMLLVCMLAGCTPKEPVYSWESTQEEPVVAETESQEDTKEDVSVEETVCMVYVCGAVKSSGVYALSPGQRIIDAIERAGGMTEDACTEYWNLAKPVEDGLMIRVPTIEEASQLPQEEFTRQQEETEETGKININTASKEQLMAIPGIGETRAEKIVEYREEKGTFSTIEDVMKVSGIKEGLYLKMKDYIRTD